MPSLVISVLLVRKFQRGDIPPNVTEPPENPSGNRVNVIDTILTHLLIS